MEEHRQLTKILLTGGTGFVGNSLVEHLRGSNLEILLMARSGHYEGTARNARYIHHDVTQPLDLDDEVPFIIHAATPASADLNARDPRRMFDLIVQGTFNVLEFAALQRSKPTVLLISSGAVYGEMSSTELVFAEGCQQAPSVLQTKSAYAEGKRVSEFLVSLANAEGKCEGLIARLFAFSGPHLPRDRHFAIGNFVRDAVRQQRIVIRGDGSAVRSYLDETDMAEWLTTVLQRGEPGFPYHIGSERAISIKDLAFLVARRYEGMTGASCEVEILGQRSPLDGVSRYVPSTKKTRELLGVEETISLEDSIDSMIRDAIITEAIAY